jgi:arabinofuranan 3-O-arabinosyltransferase
VQHWGSTARSVRVDSDPASVFVVRENFNAGWRARLGGHSLSSVQIDGWQQGFVLPADAHGTLRLTFAPQRGFVVGLLVGLLAALVVLAFALWPGSGRAEAAPMDAAAYMDVRVPTRVAVGIAALALFALAGLAGLLTLLVLGVTATVLWSWSRGIPSWFVPLTLMVGAVVVASVPSVRLFVEANDDLTQLLCLAALSAAFVGDGSERPKRLP